MPHMSPILWLILLILFSIVLILMNSTIYSLMKKSGVKQHTTFSYAHSYANSVNKWLDYCLHLFWKR